MNEMYIISFNSTHQAIKCDKLFGKNEMDYTVLPTPREITQSCGMSIAFAIEDIDNIKQMGVPNMPQQAKKEIQCITIIGEIEGHYVGNPQKKSTKYEHIIPMLYSIEENEDI